MGIVFPLVAPSNHWINAIGRFPAVIVMCERWKLLAVFLGVDHPVWFKMVSRQTLIVVGVVLIATLSVVVPAVSASEAAGDGAFSTVASEGVDASTAATLTVASAQTNETSDPGNESAFGTEMTAFMQSNAAQTEDTVENGMWEAAFQRANESAQARLATARVGTMNDRMTALVEQKERLQERYRNGTLSHSEYVRAASELHGRIAALKSGTNGTANAAERAGLNRTALETLRTQAKNMSGPDIAGVARGLTTGERGPPTSVPGQGPPGADRTEQSNDQSGTAGNGSTDRAGNETAGDAETDRSGAGTGNGNGSAGEDRGGAGGKDPGSGGSGGQGGENPGRGPG